MRKAALASFAISFALAPMTQALASETDIQNDCEAAQSQESDASSADTSETPSSPDTSSTPDDAADNDKPAEKPVSFDSLETANPALTIYSLSSASRKGYSIGFKGDSIMGTAKATASKYKKRPGQKWKLKRAKNGYCYLVNAKSGKVLTVHRAQSPANSCLTQSMLKKKASQMWVFKKDPSSASSYFVFSKLSKTLCVTVKSSKTKNGYALQLKPFDSNKSQIFTLKKASHKQTRQALIKSLNSAKGSTSITGFGGASFDRKTASGKRLNKALAAIRRSSSVCAFVMIDLKTGAGISSKANQIVYGASTIKGPYVTAICKYRAASIDRSAKSHINSVASWSSNDDYKALRSRFGSAPMKSLMTYSGVNEISSSDTWVSYSPKTLGKLWVGSYWANFKNSGKNSSYLRAKYKKGANSFIKRALKSKAVTYTKAGWGPFSSSGNIYNDAGIVVKNGHPYVVAIMSKAYNHPEQLKELVKAIDSYHDYLMR